ncbi:hypothetical protein [Sphingosinicella sp.]|jgi:hypothetical protein|uniref:hypothetical protein n=1 Tax=Sphingosinicella sp. TaxID=1917971 RepID=UPI00181D2045|nr:hypothetical protein [Sphingosinicella sp.]MBA4758192.1 hypothetical protein [Sphingosinicella sp.]
MSSDYLRMRASHCRMMAEASNDPQARRIHLELAERYGRQATEASARAAEPNAERRAGDTAARRELNARLP